jgi:archaellin
MAETSDQNHSDGSPAEAPTITGTARPHQDGEMTENGNLTSEMVIANEVIFKKGEKERKNNPIGARIKLLMVNILTKYPHARISTMTNVVIKIETMPTDDDTAAEFFGFDPETKKKYGRISFGLKIATDADSFWHFKKPMFPFLQANHIMMFEHKLKTTSVQFSRIGCLIKICPNSVHIPTMEYNLNEQIKTKWLGLPKPTQDMLYGTTLIAIPEVRLMKGKPQAKNGNQHIQTSAITVESNAGMRNVLLHILPLIYASTTEKFVPIAFKNEATVKQAARQYGTLLKVQNAFLAQHAAFAIVGVTPTIMHSFTASGRTVREELLNLQSINSVNEHQATKDYGRWILTTTHSQISEATKQIDKFLFIWASETGLLSTNTLNQLPSRSAKSPINQEYLDSLSELGDESSKSLGNSRSHTRIPNRWHTGPPSLPSEVLRTSDDKSTSSAVSDMETRFDDLSTKITADLTAQFEQSIAAATERFQLERIEMARDNANLKKSLQAHHEASEKKITAQQETVHALQQSVTLMTQSVQQIQINLAESVSGALEFHLPRILQQLMTPPNQPQFGSLPTNYPMMSTQNSTPQRPPPAHVYTQPQPSPIYQSPMPMEEETASTATHETPITPNTPYTDSPTRLHPTEPVSPTYNVQFSPLVLTQPRKLVYDIQESTDTTTTAPATQTK